MTEIKHILASDGVTRMQFMPDIGGTGVSLIMPGVEGPRELLYMHAGSRLGGRDDRDPGSSSCHPGLDPGSRIQDLIGGWPFCFPVCARLGRNGVEGAYLHQGQNYQMKIHGVSWYLPWEILQHEESRLVMQLEANDETRAVYPFEFSVTLDYQITPGKLTCQQTYSNNGDDAMPYYAGFHPYFATPPVGAGKAEVMIAFESDFRLRYNESMMDIVGRDAALTWPASAADPSINEQLSHVADKNQFILTYPNGDQVRMRCWGEVDDLFPYIQTYTMADKPFVCVEPWMDHPNALNTAGACRWLQPGQSETGFMELVCSS